MNWTQIFRENLNCYALSIFGVFILLASSDSDKHILMRQKVKDSPIIPSKMYRFLSFSLAESSPRDLQTNRLQISVLLQIIFYSYVTETMLLW